MDFVSIFVIAIALSMDAFSVSVVTSLRMTQMSWRQRFRMASAFGAFQFFMPLVGFFAGVYAEKLIQDYDHWVAFLLLAIVGVKMIMESFKHEDLDEPSAAADPTRGWTLLVLAVATSIDAIAVGFSFGLLKTSILLPSVIIGVCCFFLTYLGTLIGNKIGELGGHWVERFGGAVLILIGVKIVYEHMA